ncbi:MAG: hypothetical protein J0H01_38010 [Rhizobiales bacterium]|nr:hypothetical protein [Hyphomicrobiales bacterium]
MPDMTGMIHELSGLRGRLDRRRLDIAGGIARTLGESWDCHEGRKQRGGKDKRFHGNSPVSTDDRALRIHGAQIILSANYFRWRRS